MDFDYCLSEPGEDMLPIRCVWISVNRKGNKKVS